MLSLGISESTTHSYGQVNDIIGMSLPLWYKHARYTAGRDECDTVVTAPTTTDQSTIPRTVYGVNRNAIPQSDVIGC